MNTPHLILAPTAGVLRNETSLSSRKSQRPRQKTKPASLFARTFLSLGIAAAAHSSLSAQILYWGAGTTTPTQSVDVTSTAVNGGTWSSSITNWNASSSATTGWQAWTDGATAVIKSNKASGNSAIAVSDNITVGGISLQFDSGTQTATLASFGGGEWLSYNRSGTTSQTYTIDGSGGARTITLNEGARLISNVLGGNPQLVFGSNAILAGNHGLNLLGRMQVNSVSTVSGKATLAGIFPTSSGHGSELRINAGGSLANLDSFDIGRAAKLVVYKNTTVTNSLSDTSAVVLRNAELDLNGGTTQSSTSASETIGSISLEGTGRLDLTTNSNVASTLTLTSGINRGRNGKGVLYGYSGSASGGLGTTTGLTITGHGFASNLAVIPYAVVQGNFLDANGNAGYGTRFMATDASGNLRAAVSTAVDANLSNWASAGYSASSNLFYSVAGTSFSGALASDVTLGTLAVGYTSGSGTQTLSLSGHILEVDAIAAASNTASSLTLNIGTADANRGTITAASGRDLILISESTGWNVLAPMTVNAVVANNTGASNPGAVNLVLAGATGNITLNAANTHTGKTYVNAYTVALGSSGSLLSTSELNISGGSNFTATNSDAQNRWGSGATVQVLSGGGLYTANNRTVEIGANGTLKPGSFGAGETLNFQFTTGKLSFLDGATVALTLGTLSDSIAFVTTGDWLNGSGLFKLDLSTGAGFESGVAYSIFQNVTTTGFAPGSIWLNGTQLNASDYTWELVGSDYVFTYAVPEPSAFALLVGVGVLSIVLRRRRH